MSTLRTLVSWESSRASPRCGEYADTDIRSHKLVLVSDGRPIKDDAALRSSEPARRTEHLAGRITGLVGGQKHVQGCNLGRLPWPSSDGFALSERHDHALRLTAAHLQRRPKRSGCDRIDTDAFWAKLLCERLGKRHFRRFRQ